MLWTTFANWLLFVSGANLEVNSSLLLYLYLEIREHWVFLHRIRDTLSFKFWRDTWFPVWCCAIVWRWICWGRWVVQFCCKMTWTYLPVRRCRLCSIWSWHHTHCLSWEFSQWFSTQWCSLCPFVFRESKWRRREVQGWRQCTLIFWRTMRFFLIVWVSDFRLAYL